MEEKTKSWLYGILFPSWVQWFGVQDTVQDSRKNILIEIMMTAAKLITFLANTTTFSKKTF